MDPISRRAVWDAINAAKQQAAVVLTTHSMEEADALGDRIAIMVRGRMRVLGGSLTLKQKYGNGYQVGVAHHALHCRTYTVDG
jgi:ABC-type multidrug transport system ATPase subunit